MFVEQPLASPRSAKQLFELRLICFKVDRIQDYEKNFFFFFTEKYINRSEDWKLSSWLMLSQQALGGAAATGYRR